LSTTEQRSTGSTQKRPVRQSPNTSVAVPGPSLTAGHPCALQVPALQVLMGVAAVTLSQFPTTLEEDLALLKPDPAGKPAPPTPAPLQQDVCLPGALPLPRGGAPAWLPLGQQACGMCRLHSLPLCLGVCLWRSPRSRAVSPLRLACAGNCVVVRARPTAAPVPPCGMLARACRWCTHACPKCTLVSQARGCSGADGARARLQTRISAPGTCLYGIARGHAAARRARRQLFRAVPLPGTSRPARALAWPAACCAWI
jgi:hypothetical protein